MSPQKFNLIVHIALQVLLAGRCSAQTVPRAATNFPLPTPLTLQDAIRIALHDQPTQAIAQTQVTQANAAGTVAKAQYLPTITPSYQYTSSRQTYYGTTISALVPGQTIPYSGVTDLNGGTGNLAITEHVFDSGTREVSNALARQQVASAKFGVVDTSQQVIANVTQAFYELLRSQDLLRVSNADVARAQAVLDQTQGEIDAGVLAKKSVYQAKADLATSQVSQLQNQDTVRTSAATLKNTMGIETDAEITPAPLSSGADKLPEQPQSDPAQTLDQYLLTAYSQRADLKEQESSLAQAQLNVKQAKVNAGLALSGTVQLDYQPLNDTGSRGNLAQAIVGGSYPLFDGGATRAVVRSSEAQRDAAYDRLVQLRQQIRLDLDQASIQRSEAFARIGLAQAAVESAQVNYDSAVESQKEGVGTIIDITTAEATLTQAQNQYVTAIYDYYEADARLKRALGINDQGVVR